MPRINSEKEAIPEKLKPYFFHGVDLNYRDGADNATGECPFCGKEKFSVVVETGQYRCLSCNHGKDNGKVTKGGNAYGFIQSLLEYSAENTKDTAYQDIAEVRRFLELDTPKQWGMAYSTTTHEWLIPGFNAEGKQNQLYRYCKIGDKYRLLATPTMSHGLHGVNLYDKRKGTVYLCEGPWDAMALWEVLGLTKQAGEDYAVTSNEKLSLLNDANVLAVPGCQVFNEAWLPLFAGKNVVLCYDSDHPTKHKSTGADVGPVGYEAMQRVYGVLVSAKQPPASIQMVKWGGKGYNPDLPSGFDVRDALSLGLSGATVTIKTPTGRVQAFSRWASLINQPPEEWATGASKATKTKGKVEGIDLLPCKTYRELVQAWRKAMKWTSGLDHGFTVMLACVISTRSIGDQLWAKVIAPASSGKTTLGQALAACQEFVKVVDTLRGFTSGFRLNDEGDTADLASDLNGMTLITLDGDTLIQSPNIENILSEARRLYDGSINSHFKNGTGKDTAGHRMTWILCGTSSLRTIDSSELGERFIDVVMMEGIDDDLEDEVCWRAANKAKRNVAVASDSKAESHQDPDMTQAIRLTGGYVKYLRDNAQDLLSQIDMDDDMTRMCMRLGKFVAYMRARPSSVQDENAEREFSARLASQHVRLAMCLAAILNKPEVDAEVMARVKRVAMDTSRGQTLDIIRYLYKCDEAGAEVKAIATVCSRTEDQVRKMLRFLKQIGAVESFAVKVKGLSTAKQKNRLTAKLHKLYGEVTSDA